MTRVCLASVASMLGLVDATLAQNLRFDDLADPSFPEGYLSKQSTATLQDELVLQRAVLRSRRD